MWSAGGFLCLSETVSAERWGYSGGSLTCPGLCFELDVRHGNEKVAGCCGIAMFGLTIGEKAPRWGFQGCGRTFGWGGLRSGESETRAYVLLFWRRKSSTKTWSTFSKSSQLCFVGNGSRRTIPEQWFIHVLPLSSLCFQPFFLMGSLVVSHGLVWCFPIDTPNMITRLPVFGTKHMKLTWT